MRGFHDFLKQKTSSLFRCSSISVTSLMMYLDLVERILMTWSWTAVPQIDAVLRLICPDVQDVCWWCALILVSIKRPVCPV
jgi:hypothetical protein